MNTRIPSKTLLIAGTALAASSVFGGYVWHQEHRPPILEIYIFPLKSGRSLFVRTPDDTRILVDGGANAEVIRHLSSVLPFYSRRIDALITTDTDGKNVSGLIDVLGRYTVSRAYIPAITLNTLGLSSSTDPSYSAFLDAVAEKGIALTGLTRGDFIAAGDIVGKDRMIAHEEVQVPNTEVHIDVLFPAPAKDISYSRASPPQLVTKITYGQRSILILNDASVKIQKYIASDVVDAKDARKTTIPIGALSADVLVVSHSASAELISRDLITASRPDYLVYSKTISKSTQKSSAGSSSKKKIIPDPLAGILSSNRFNLKEGKTVRISSDGKDLVITKTD